MNLHQSDISGRLQRFLERRQMPRRLAGKEAATADELRALLGAVERGAPRGAEALANWWPGFETALGANGNQYWPSEKDVTDACRKVAPPRPREMDPDGKPDECVIMGRRMEAGEAIGEPYVYGFKACELIRRGLVSEATMARYRSAFFLKRRSVYGEEAARAWEARAKAEHESAMSVSRSNSRDERFDG